MGLKVGDGMGAGTGHDSPKNVFSRKAKFPGVAVGTFISL